MNKGDRLKPIVTQAGTRRIIAGHGRLEAMRSLGWDECDIVDLDVDDTTATALAIALNRSGELATLDDAALGQLLTSLPTLDGTGFSTDQLDELIASRQKPGAVEDPGPVEPPATATTQRGDVWLLDKHRLMCGDSTSQEVFTALMHGQRATLLSTDPPYCVNYTGNDRPIHDGKPSGKDWTAVYREIDIADLGVFLDGMFAAVLPHTVERLPVYMWHAHVQQPTIAAAFERHGLLLHQVLVWVKPCAVFGHSYYRWKHEPCAFGWRQGSKPEHGVGQLETVWEADWDGKARVTTFHPTSKPTKLFEIPIEQHTSPGDLVVEPFNGSGSQILAAEKLARRCYAMELQPVFVDGTVDRWQQATGKQATLEATGQTYVEVHDERAAAQV
ncbi:MAG: DNA methyltransferase [Vicinamibacterales bacterium]